MSINVYFQFAGFMLEFFALYLMYAVSVNILYTSNRQKNEIGKQYTLGLGLFLFSVATSGFVYTVDLLHREFIGGRIFPSEQEYAAMGFEFDSFHPQFYFIILLSGILLSIFFLVRPLEKYMLKYRRPILGKLCLFSFPLPFIIRILELITLPKEGTPLFYIYTAMYIYIWVLIFTAILMLIGIHIKLAASSTGEVRIRAISVVIGIFLWLTAIFQRSTLLKGIKDEPWTFWILPAMEIGTAFFFIYGFAQIMEYSFGSNKKRYIYDDWFFKVFVIGISATVALYFAVWFWNEDLSLVIALKHIAETDPFWGYFADFMDRSMFGDGAFGGQDISYIALFAAIIIYILSFVPSLEKKLKNAGMYAGFFIATAAVLALVNRIFKTFFARVRPGDAIADPSLYTPQWCFGKLPLDDAFSSGSFTSGHTTTAAMLITLAFILIYTRKKWVILLSFAVTITFTVLMGLGRVLHGAHYPSDTLWAFWVSLTVITIMYFKVFRIPAMEEGTYTPKKKPYAILFTLLFLVWSIFVLLLLIGIKYTFIEFAWYWPLAAVIGGLGTFFLWKPLKKTLE